MSLEAASLDVTAIGVPAVTGSNYARERHAATASAPTRAPDADDLLLRRIGSGEETAFRVLVERHIDRAYALALRILKNPADAEDVVQETLLKIWNTRGSWEEGRARFSTWLYRVVTNRCLDLRRRPRMEEMENAPDLVSAEPDALTHLHRHEISGLLQQAIDRLPDQQRVALILSYFDELGNAEIAEVMDTTVPAVESLLKRGRQSLRKSLNRLERDIRDLFTRD